MPARLFLAILVLTNPICCQVFGSSGFERAEKPVAECAGCTCECDKSSQPASSNDEQNTPHRPCKCPNCELCQCVCAGAVVQDIVTVDDSNDEPAVDAIPECPIDTPSILLCATCFFDVQMACDDANVGRSARIRHASLLC